MPKIQKETEKQRPRMWELRQAADLVDVLELYIYGDVSSGYYNDFWDEWMGSETSANYFREKLEEYPGVREIRIYINSEGGSVFEGTAIYNQLRRHPARKVVRIDGFACSIASVIAMAGDEIIMPANTMMFLHNMAWIAQGNPAELRRSADDLEKINRAGAEAYLDKAKEKLSPETLTELMNNETWLTAAECLELGLCDRIADAVEDLNLEQAMQRSTMNLTQRMNFHKSLAAQLRQLCPQQSVAARPAEKKVEEKTPQKKPAAPLPMCEQLAAIFKNKEE